MHFTLGPHSGTTDTESRTMGRRRSRWLRPVIVWLLLCSAAAYILFGGTRNAVRVLRDTRVTQGTITELRPDHVVVFVRYTVDGASHVVVTNHTEEAGLGAFDKLRSGDVVPIEFNPAFPGEGIPGSARALLISNLKDFGEAALLCLAITVAVEFMIRRQQATDN